MWAPREVEISLAWPKMRKSVWKEQDLGLLLIFDLLLWSVWAGRCWIGAPTYICWPGQASGGQHLSCKTRHVWADGSCIPIFWCSRPQPLHSFSQISAPSQNWCEFNPFERTEGITAIKVSWSFWKHAKNAFHCLEFICCDFAIIRAWTFINYTEFIQRKSGNRCFSQLQS